MGGHQRVCGILPSSKTSPPALCVLKAEMLPLYAGLTISIDNSASSGDNTGYICPGVPGIGYLAGPICSARIGEALSEGPTGLFPVLQRL